MNKFDDLKTALINKKVDRIKAILQENIEFLEKIDDSNTALLYWFIGEQDNGTIENPEEIVKFLLENYKININQTTHERHFTALHEAVTCQQKKIVKTLLRYGAKILPTSDGFTPLHFATNRNDIEITKLLLDADPHAAHLKNSEGNTPAHLAALENRNASTFNLLIEKVANHKALLLTENNQQETPFHIAMARADSEFLVNEKKDFIKIALLENPMLEMPNAISEKQIMLTAWHAYKTDIKTMQATKVTTTTTLYDLATTIDPDTLSTDIIEEINIKNLTATTKNFPYYKDFLTDKINKLAFIKNLKNEKIDSSYNHSLYDIYQEKDKHKLRIIFSNPEIENGVRVYLENADFSRKAPLSYKDKIINTLEDHMAAGVQLNRSVNNIVDDINNGETEGGLLPHEMKIEILSYLSPEELNQISDEINHTGLSEVPISSSGSRLADSTLFTITRSESPSAKKIRISDNNVKPSISGSRLIDSDSSFFNEIQNPCKRRLSDSDSDSEEEKPQKKPRLATKNW